MQYSPTQTSESVLYQESISSTKTEVLFLALSLLFASLFTWHAAATGINTLAIVFLLFACIFVFYSVNFRTLIIHLTIKALTLHFGIFSWRVFLVNIASCQLDEIPAFMRYRGAGIHFMSVRSRYRTSFNFLEYPRLVFALKHKMGLVQEVSFTTRQPDILLRFITQAVASHT